MRQLLFFLVVTSALSCELQPLVNITARVDDSDITVLWSRPSAEDPSCVRGYNICLKQDNSDERRCQTLLDADINMYMFLGLPSCTKYVISLMVLGDNVTTSKPVSLIASTAPASPHDVNFYRRNNDTIVAYWSYIRDAGRLCATQFQLSLCDVRETTCTTSTVAADRIYYSQDLRWKQDCNAYVVKMEVIDSSQQTSSTYIYRGAPGFMDVPVNLRVTHYTSSSFDLEWAVPTSLIGCDFFVSVYTESQVGNTRYSTIYSDDGSTTTYKVTRANSCTKYEVRVTFGMSETAKSAITTAYTLPKGESVFNSTRVVEITETAVQLEWTRSLENSQCIAAYTVCWKVQGAIDVNCRNVTNSDYSLKITGLEAYTSYKASITALLQNGVEYDIDVLEFSMI